MADLFNPDLFAYRGPGNMARRSDPSTSHEAAEKIVPKLGDLQRRVLAELRAAGAVGLCDLELETRCGSHGSTFRTRRSELVDLGLVRDSGRKIVLNGRNRVVWVAVS